MALFCKMGGGWRRGVGLFCKKAVGGVKVGSFCKKGFWRVGGMTLAEVGFVLQNKLWMTIGFDLQERFSTADTAVAPGGFVLQKGWSRDRGVGLFCNVMIL
jgi:hypothetical protein